METVPITIIIPKGALLPGDLCHRLGIEDFREMPPDKMCLFGHRDVTAMIEEVIPGMEVIVSDIN